MNVSVRARTSAVVVAVASALACGSMIPTASAAPADTSCSSGLLCYWTQPGYQGTKWVSGALSGICYSGVPTQSVKNRTSRAVTFYESSDCSWTGDAATVYSGGSDNSLGFVAHSYLSG
ncbi:MAG: peptidase inhibitor family I36 protein [Candidatus Dormibacteria bacterium]